MRWSKKSGAIMFLGFIVMMLLCGIIYRKQVLAIFNPDTAIHMNAASIDNATLIIGTHLIYLGSLNDYIYEIAMTSAQDSGQHSVYYKSELADGAWLDITDASSLEDIMASGIRMENEYISGLAVTHYTKADGITYDLRRNEAVSIFNIYDIYELEQLAELEPLKIRYDRLKEENMEEAEKNHYITAIRNFFRTTLTKVEEIAFNIKQEEITQVHTEETKKYEEQMQALQSYYEILKSNGAASAETDVVLKVMNKLDSTKRVVVYKIVEEALDRLRSRVQENANLEESLLTAVEESRLNVTDEIMAQEENAFSMGTTAMSNLEYNLEQELIIEAYKKQHSACDMVVTKLNSLYHIMDSQIIAKPSELDIASELIDKMEQKYAKSLEKGVDEEYEKAVEDHSSHVILENIVKSQTVEWNVLRSELQFYIQAKVDRLETEEALAFVNDKIGSSGQLRAVIPLDAYQVSAKDTVETYVTWLQKLYASLSGEGGLSELDKLQEEKMQLQEDKMAALDKEDIRVAKKVEAKILAKAEEISKIEAAVTSELVLLEANKTALEVQIADQAQDSPSKTTLINQLANIQQQIAQVGTKLSDESTAQNIQDMKQNALNLIKEGETSNNKLEELAGYIEGIGTFLELGSALALDSQKKIYNAMLTATYLKEQTDYDSLIARIEEQIENNMGNQRGDTLTASAALSVIEEALGGSLTVKKVGGLPLGNQSTGDIGETQGGDGTVGGSTGSVGTGGTDTAGGSTGSVGTGGTDTVGGSTGSVGTGEGNVVEEVTVETDSIEKEEVLAAMVALADYGEQTENEEIRSMAAGLAVSMMKENNSCAFEKINSVNGSFAPASALADYLHYRYLWNDSKKTAVVANGLTYYRFTAFYNTVERNGEQSDTMSIAAEFKKTVYIPSDYLYQEFGCQVINITGTNYAILVDDDVIKEAEKLRAALIEKEGEK